MWLVSGWKNQFNTLCACHLPNFPHPCWSPFLIGRCAFPETGAEVLHFLVSKRAKWCFFFFFKKKQLSFLDILVREQKTDYYLNRSSSSIPQQIKQQTDASSEYKSLSALPHIYLHLCIYCTLSLSHPSVQANAQVSSTGTAWVLQHQKRPARHQFSL